MILWSNSLVLSCLFGGTIAKALYPQTTLRPPSVLYDFQKDNVSASWAPGHPKEWSDREALQFEFSDGGPFRFTSGAIFATALSIDEKFLVTVNTSNHVSVIDFATGTTTWNQTLVSTSRVADPAVRILSSTSGYDVLVSISLQEVQRIQLSPQGTQLGNTTIYPGGLLFGMGSPSVSHSQRRFITTVPTTGQYTIYDLDDASVHLTLPNQPDDMYDASFAPNDQSVATRSHGYSGLPGTTKLWDTHTGALLRNFNDTQSETLSISPDGTLLATALSWNAIQLWSLSNPTLPPTTLAFPTTTNGIQRLAWSPDSSYLAVGAFKGLLLVWNLDPTPTLVQRFQIDNAGHDVSALLWLPGPRLRLAYRVFGGLEVYDFAANLKFRWGFVSGSHWVDGAYMVGGTLLAQARGWIGGLDGDANVRFWEVPV